MICQVAPSSYRQQVGRQREGGGAREGRREDGSLGGREREGGRGREGERSGANKGRQDVNNRQARRPRAAHGRRIAARDTASESDEGEVEGEDWGECYTLWGENVPGKSSVCRKR